MMYIIVNNDTGMFVAPRGSDKSYVRTSSFARVYTSKESAERDACGNETVIPYDPIARALERSR